jgi:hypothetical protein
MGAQNRHTVIYCLVTGIVRTAELGDFILVGTAYSILTQTKAAMTLLGDIIL